MSKHINYNKLYYYYYYYLSPLWRGFKIMYIPETKVC